MTYNILLVEDSYELQNAISMTLKEHKDCSFKIVDDINKARFALESEIYDIILSDKKLPDGDGIELLSFAKELNPEICFILMTAYPEAEHIKDAINKGIFYYLTKPFKKYELEIVLRLAMQNIKLKKQVEYYREKESYDIDEFFLEGGHVFTNVIDNIKKIARTTANCLVCGESGVGKEVVARLIHKFSDNKDAPFVVVNCPAVTPNLFESELFGYEKGAFTGAVGQKRGKFELAHNGTILLDEITEIPIELQSKLLRVIQERVIERVGSLKPIHINVRVIATTNRNIQLLVENGKFRDDLYHRLNVVRIDVPPLRNRLEDMGDLVSFFLKKFSKKCGFKEKKILPESIAFLKLYNWPGNVRELANFIERIYVLESNASITEDIVKKYLSWERRTDSFEFSNSQLKPSPHSTTLPSSLPSVNINYLEKIAIETALKLHNFNKSKAARDLGITDRTLRNKLKQYKIEENISLYCNGGK